MAKLLATLRNGNLEPSEPIDLPEGTQLLITVNLAQETEDWTDDFAHAGLKRESLIRLSYLSTIPPNQAGKCIGYLSNITHQRLLSKLSNYLNPPTKGNE